MSEIQQNIFVFDQDNQQQQIQSEYVGVRQDFHKQVAFNNQQNNQQTISQCYELQSQNHNQLSENIFTFDDGQQEQNQPPFNLSKKPKESLQNDQNQQSLINNLKKQILKSSQLKQKSNHKQNYHGKNTKIEKKLLKQRQLNQQIEEIKERIMNNYLESREETLKQQKTSEILINKETKTNLKQAQNTLKSHNNIDHKQNHNFKIKANLIKAKDVQSPSLQRFQSSQFNDHNNNTFDEFKQNLASSPPQKYEMKMQGAKIKSLKQKISQVQYVQEQKALKVTNMKQFLNTQLSQQYKINALIKKAPNTSLIDSILNKTKYYILIQQNNKFLFSITKDSIGKYIFSLSKDQASDKNKNYLGKMVSKDFNNTEFLLYDDGFDPKQTKSLEFSHKQIGCIKYQESNGPRKFQTIISTNNKGFHSIQDNDNVLQKKWSVKKQRKNLVKLYSKQPEFDEVQRLYKLDFKGMIGKPSIKNFIMTSEEYQNSLMFTRRNEDTYAFEVKHPFSLIQAVGICMSSIVHKTMF